MNLVGYCILLVEDEPIVRYVMARALTCRGYSVIEAGDSREAVQRQAEYNSDIHVLITDVRMPGVDGHELARLMKEQRPGIKVLIVSAQSESDFPPEAKSHDCALLKPVAPDTVVKTVAKLVRQLSDSSSTLYDLVEDSKNPLGQRDLETITTTNREKRFRKAIAAWDGQSGEWFWISFADDGGFLGVCIVRAPRPALAPFVATMRRCHPGGEARFTSLPDESEQIFHPFYTYRLLTRAEAAEVEEKARRACVEDVRE